MSMMVDHVARAICEAEIGGKLRGTLDETGSPNHWRSLARAAIEAMRMPEAAQLAAARPYTGDGGLAWRAMIDAALKD